MKKYRLPILFLTKQGEWDQSDCYSSSTSAHTKLTVTRVVLGTRPQAGGSVSHKLTGSSLCTQRVYKQATAPRHCYWLAEHNFIYKYIDINEQGQGSYWREQRIKDLIWLQLSAQSVNGKKDVSHDLAATTDAHLRPVRVHTETRKGLTS